MTKMNSKWKETQNEVTNVVKDLEATLNLAWEEFPPSEEMKDEAQQCFIFGFQNYTKDFIEEHKQKLVKHHISVLRDQIEKLWQQCCFTESQKDEFPEFTSVTFNIQLMKKHKQYLASLELLYKNNKTVFDSAEKYSDLWQHLQDLEKQEHDPNKFNNRGAQLLKNEKERKEGKKELVRLASELVTMASQHEEEYGNQLSIHGLSVEMWLQKFKLQQKEHCLLSGSKARVRPWQAGMANHSTSTAKKRAAPTCNDPPPVKNCKKALNSKFV